MSTRLIREELHEYINKADTRLLNLIYAMVQADLPEDSFITPEERIELDKRIARHEKGESESYSWEEVKSRFSK